MLANHGFKDDKVNGKVTENQCRSGPLSGLRIVEMSGKGPAPFCGMMLSDMGADVVRIDRVAGSAQRYEHYVDPLSRGRRSVAVDLKTSAGVSTVRRLAASADGLIEGYRPGVMERLGLGPEDCLADNPRLVYGRVTGWGQVGPLAQAAGHDLNYVALTGVLNAIGEVGRPPPAPLALIGDFGGGGMFLAFGVVSALLNAQRCGEGQIVDAAMIEGVSSLAAFTHGLRAAGWWRDERQANMLDGGAHFYGNYETKDGKFISIGAIEPEFYADLIARLGIDAGKLPKKMDRTGWPQWRAHLAGIFAEKTRDEWCDLLEGTDACFAPVLTFDEARTHPQNLARGTFTDYQGITQPAPSPQFSLTPGAIQGPAPQPGQNSCRALSDWGLTTEEINNLIAIGAVYQAET